MMRPVDALDTQLALIKYFRSTSGISYLQAFADNVRDSGMVGDQSGMDLAKTESSRLDAATTFFVTEDMVKLVEYSSWVKMPTQKFSYEDLPSHAGFVVLANPVLTRDFSGNKISFGAFSWGPFQAIKDKLGNTIEGVAVCLYSDIRDERDDYNSQMREAILRTRPTARFQFFHVLAIRYGDDIGDLRYHIEESEHADEEGGVAWDQLNNMEQETVDTTRFVYAFWNMCHQKIASNTRTRLDRAAMRRMQRGLAEPPEDYSIQIVSLRRQKPPQDSEPTEGAEVRWSHRWITHGFWRNQPYPSLGIHKLIWIDDYVKGPAHLPLVIKDPIYNLKR